MSVARGVSAEDCKGSTFTASSSVHRRHGACDLNTCDSHRGTCLARHRIDLHHRIHSGHLATLVPAALALVHSSRLRSYVGLLVLEERHPLGHGQVCYDVPHEADSLLRVLVRSRRSPCWCLPLLLRALPPLVLEDRCRSASSKRAMCDRRPDKLVSSPRHLCHDLCSPSCC